MRTFSDYDGARIEGVREKEPESSIFINYCSGRAKKNVFVSFTTIGGK